MYAHIRLIDVDFSQISEPISCFILPRVNHTLMAFTMLTSWPVVSCSLLLLVLLTVNNTYFLKDVSLTF